MNKVVQPRRVASSARNLRLRAVRGDAMITAKRLSPFSELASHGAAMADASAAASEDGGRPLWALSAGEAVQLLRTKKVQRSGVQCVRRSGSSSSVLGRPCGHAGGMPAAAAHAS